MPTSTKRGRALHRKETGAMVIGNETVANVACAYDVLMCSSWLLVEGRTMRLGRSLEFLDDMAC